jgi:hypothetical protein
VNIETAKWHCFKCKIAGQGLNGPSGLLAALGVSQDAFSFSAKPTAKRRIAERKKAQASEPKKSSPVMSQDELRGLFNTAYQEVIVTF